MDKATRRELLKARLRALGGYHPLVRAEAKRRIWTPSKPFQFVHPMGFAGRPGFPSEWVTKADPVSDEPKVSPDRRTKGDSIPTRIAARWDERKTIPPKRKKHSLRFGWYIAQDIAIPDEEPLVDCWRINLVADRIDIHVHALMGPRKQLGVDYHRAAYIHIGVKPMDSYYANGRANGQ